MRRTSTFLAYLSLALGSLCFYRVRCMPGLLLAIPKLFASALAPLVAAAGTTGALMGLAGRRRWAAAAGAAGALAAYRHARRVTAPHGDFAAAFGPDWRSRIPPDLRARMLPRRWAVRLPQVPAPRWERHVTYSVATDAAGRPRPLLCDLWHPPEDVPPTGLALLYFHGGAWHLGDKDLHVVHPRLIGVRPLFRHLAAQGHLVVDVAYRLCPEVQINGMLADVQRAIVWVKENARRLGVDPGRIVVAGDSAGGHLALLAAYTAGTPSLTPEDLAGADTSVRGVVSYYGVTDLRILCAHVRPMQGGPPESAGEHRELAVRLLDAADRVAILATRVGTPAEVRALGDLTCERILGNLLGAPPEDAAEEMALASPITHVHAGCPPTLLFHGTHNSLSPVEGARALYRRLRDAGVPAIYNELPQAEHGYTYVIPEWSPAFHATLYDTECFLGLLSGESPARCRMEGIEGNHAGVFTRGRIRRA